MGKQCESSVAAESELSRGVDPPPPPPTLHSSVAGGVAPTRRLGARVMPGPGSESGNVGHIVFAHPGLLRVGNYRALPPGVERDPLL
jgi:hypothetical protein